MGNTGVNGISSTRLIGSLWRSSFYAAYFHGIGLQRRRYPNPPRADVCWRRRKWHTRQTKIVVTRYGWGPEVITVA